jgi:hypothetical protein
MYYDFTLGQLNLAAILRARFLTSIHLRLDSPKTHLEIQLELIIFDWR